MTMKFRTLIVLGIIPTCILCDQVFLPSAECPFVCAPCCTGEVSLDALTRAFLKGARRYTSSVKSVQSVSSFTPN